jgi:hypothetical protein
MVLLPARSRLLRIRLEAKRARRFTQGNPLQIAEHRKVS